MVDETLVVRKREGRGSTFRIRWRPNPRPIRVVSTGIAVLVALLVTGSGETTQPRWSPDRRVVARAVPCGAPTALYTEIWVGRPDGPAPLRIKSYLGEPGDLCFLPSRRTIVYLQHALGFTALGSHLSGGRYIPLIRNRIWKLAVDGSSESQWPLPDDLQPLSIAISPEGDRLAVAGFVGDLLDGSDAGLWVVDHKGRALRLVRGPVRGPLQWTDDSNHVRCTIAEGPSEKTVRVHAQTGETTDVNDEPRVSHSAKAPEEATFSRHLGAFDALNPKEQGNVHRTLGTIGRVRHYYMRAHRTMHRCDYPVMKRDYKRAITAFKGLHRLKAGISKADCRGHIRGIERRLDMDGEQFEELACREHMLVLRDLAEAYAQANDGDAPPDLDALRDWIRNRIEQDASDEETLRRDLEPLPILFRCTSDEIPAYRSSYVYRREASPGDMALSAFCHEGKAFHITGIPARYGARSEAFTPAQVDSLDAVADRCLEKGDVDRAIQLLEAVANQRRDGSSFAKLGHVHLAEGRPLIAEQVFEKALSEGRKEDVAEAFYGLGLVYLNHPKGGHRNKEMGIAADHFSEALTRNPDHMDARFQRARARFSMKWIYDSKDELEQFLSMYPDHAEAILLMGDWYADLAEEYENAIVWYSKYVAMRPEDAKAARRLGVAYLELRDYDRIMDSLLGFTRENPDAVEVMPIVAQACVKKGKLDLALGMFQEYLSKVDTVERDLYDDIRLISSAEELAEYESVTEEGRESYLKPFWNGRDPDLSTPVNERQLEHYRRVWYARAHFSRGKVPWDARGEVYVRFGEPDHKTSSRMMNAEQSLEVQRVKERMALELYGTQAAGETYVGTVYPVRSRTFAGQMDVDRSFDATEVDFSKKEDESLVGGFDEAAEAGAAEGEGGETGQPNDAADGESGGTDGAEGDSESLADEYWYKLTEYQPVSTSQADLSSVAWESWVYARVGSGIEITFTDEAHNGVFDYAPMPLAPDIRPDQIRRFARYAPKTVYERAAAAVPDHHIAEYAAQPYEFYFDIADFRGAEGHTEVEVYYGMPNTSARYRSNDDLTELVVSRQAALVASEADTVFRTADQLVYRASGDRRTRGAFVPDVARLEVPPGVYRMEVRARNRLDGRLGIYRKSVIVKDYRTEDLELSDLQLAWSISESETEGKFAKQGLQVIPLPTRTFRKGKSVYIYFEIYNLTRDAFGQTRYRVQYTVRPHTSTGLGGIVAQLAQTFTGRKREEVAIGYEQVGLEESEAAYVELDLGDSRTGRYDLRVEVTDLNAERVIGKETSFMVEE